ncbi:apolipoprotein N-acyltransferase [Actinomadura kijaniata]|uniref:Apolipoprotein N-acyltransferase n=1 Tax=Actinomadura namibiensis TaxID=182080 RepID=A0A7W3LPB0_ACTNM|nr:apolipoprotein N-acyltransferase [Actinomadura namibiensis]MBA8951803.1 apolipoprotein N-acyltransferase [Actinomadura namibiensis]
MIARARIVAAVAGALPLLAFPAPGLGWLAWVALVPGILVIRAAASVREAAARGWWFGAGYLLAALYWTLPNIGPGLLLVALVFGAPWAAWGAAVRWLVPERPLAALAVLPSVWVVIELLRSWPQLGGPWALLGASQWAYPPVLGLAALGGVWLVSFALVVVNVAVVLVLSSRRRYALAAAVVAAGPLVSATRDAEPERTLRVALIQPGVIRDPAARLAEGERITGNLPPADLVVWGESSVSHDLRSRTDVTARLTALAARGELLVNEDARDASGRISKSAVLVGPDGPRARYVKTRLVPFGEYVPFRPAFGWLTRVSRAAGEDRVPGTGATTLTAAGTTVGPLICFESAFPDLGRAVTRRGARLLVYQSSTATFQESWAPPQHASLAAVRAAETGRPAVQAALTGVSAAFDARGRRLAWLDTGQRGAAVVTVPLPPDDPTPYVRFGDYVAYLSLAVSTGAALAAARKYPESSMISGTKCQRRRRRSEQGFGKQQTRGGASGVHDAE